MEPEIEEAAALLSQASLGGQRKPHGRALRVSHTLTGLVGSIWSFVATLVAGAIWIGIGVGTNYPRWWELIGSVGIPFLALLALFFLQHTQNHNDRALQLKLDELLRALGPADDALMAIEDANENDLEDLRVRYRAEIPIDSGPDHQGSENNPERFDLT